MSSPKALVQLVVIGAQSFVKAFVAAGRQAHRNIQHRPEGGISGDAAGVGNATTGSITDKITREHRMTAEEARMILNVKKDDPLERILQHYQHLFKANSPPPPPPKPVPGQRVPPPPAYSHYLQSKVVRARERIEAELKVGEQPSASTTDAPPPPPPPSSSSSGPKDQSS
ncbi:uncharacterized protein LAESUDRAFT_672215 [Laetiporus sulphureus 93-53]|uniref:Mitochondrial import inner membrane translocase subunit TIM16 n=1 Tax=Laetiporus sulphureus 93-53 TaxID=1314785 RepID=A0A165GSI6_9APHY|nr:uncharacterized protein LAESUDRAFT_672215 [Laetiporus sulphureus 93-53]KZT10748.1 hypothetical protein LAESUDRAFT_672215 [Laetiporus sulphureus 93-53]